MNARSYLYMGAFYRIVNRHCRAVKNRLHSDIIKIIFIQIEIQSHGAGLI